MHLLDTIDRWAKICPERLAHISSNSAVTYEELKQRSDALACFISGQLPRDRSPIMVYGHKQSDMLVCFLAAAKAGHAYIPVDISVPAERVSSIWKNSDASMAIALADWPPACGIPNVLINSNQLQEIYTKYNRQQPGEGLRVGEQDDYYIIYTSGSTGEPKGVRITLECLDSFLK